MSLRTDRVSEIIRKIVGTKLLGLAPATPFTITAVDVSPDLHYATVWLVTLRPASLEDDLKALNWVKPKLQAELSRNLASKYTPVISFRLDQSSGHVNRIDELLDNIDSRP